MPDPTTHMSNPDSFMVTEDGFFYPMCSCGWAVGPVPDIETMVDALMEHALYAGANLATGRPVDTGMRT